MSDMGSETLQPCYEKSKEIISLELCTFLHSQLSPRSSAQKEEKMKIRRRIMGIRRRIFIF